MAVLESFQASVRSLGVSRERLYADLLIHELFAGVEEDAIAARASDTRFSTGVRVDRDERFFWSTDIVDLGGTATRRLYRVDVRVWRDGGYRDYRAATYQSVTDF